MHSLVWYVVIDLDDSTLSQTQPDASQVKSRAIDMAYLYYGLLQEVLR